MRRELNDVKRQLNECGIEKEKYLLSNKELRDFIKKSEAEKREQARSLEESHQKITGMFYTVVSVHLRLFKNISKLYFCLRFGGQNMPTGKREVKTAERLQRHRI